MPNPVSGIPSGPLPITPEINTQAETFVRSLLQVFLAGTTGAPSAGEETDATYYQKEKDENPGVLHLNSRQQQLFFRQLGVVIAKTFPGATGGEVGPPGPPGPEGPPGLNWLGPWSALTAYVADDAVEYEGSSYVATAPSTIGVPPAATGTTTPNAGWSLLAKKGNTGPAWEPPPPAFDAALSGGATLEVGQGLVSPAFTATYNRPPTSASIQDNQGNPAQDVILTPNAFTIVRTYVKSVADQSVLFTLTAADATGSDVASVSAIWRQRAYWGVGLDAQRTEAFIKALANNQLTSSRQRSFTVDAYNSTLHIYYCYRAAYGPSTFWVGGFEGGFDGPYIVSVTNAYGVTENYYLYQSVQPGLGVTTVTVQ